MSPTLITIPPEILDRIIKEIAPPRTPKPPLARRSTIGDRCLGDVSRNDAASSTLSSLSQTCKTLHTHCLPQIFGTITISRRGGLHRLKKTLKRSTVLANLARKNARSISIHVKFRLFHDVSRFDKNEKRIRQLGSILRCCSSVTALHLTNVLFDLGMVEILAQMKALRSLSLEVVFSGTKISKLKQFNELCRDEEDWMEFDEELPPLESLHFSPPLRSYSYDRLISAVKRSLKELSIHTSTACLDWTGDYLISAIPGRMLMLEKAYFPRLERVFIHPITLSLGCERASGLSCCGCGHSGTYTSGPILPFLYRHRVTIREITLLPKRFIFGETVPELSYIWLIIRYMAGEDIDIPLYIYGCSKNEILVDGFSVVFGEWVAPSEGRRPVLELGLSLGESRRMIDRLEYGCPLSDLSALLGPECFDQLELIALDTIYNHAFFFSEFIIQLERICVTRFTKLKDISLSWDARDTCWSRSEPRRFTKLPSSSDEDSCEFNEEWVSANYSIAESLICGLLQRTAIERLELVPVFGEPSIHQRPDNFTPFESWVWKKSSCGSKVYGSLWKRTRRAPFIAVGIGSERETQHYWTEPAIDEDESDELQEWELEEDYD